MTDTVKYLIVFLAVLSIALVIVIGYIAVRLCSRRTREIKLDRRQSQPRQDPQFVVAPDDAKDIFTSSRRRRKQHNADHVAAADQHDTQSASSAHLQQLRVPVTPPVA